MSRSASHARGMEPTEPISARRTGGSVHAALLNSFSLKSLMWIDVPTILNPFKKNEKMKKKGKKKECFENMINFILSCVLFFFSSSSFVKGISGILPIPLIYDFS